MLRRIQGRSKECTETRPEGYVLRIPKGLEGIAGDRAGPERGVSITLPSGGKILSIGEPNSLESVASSFRIIRWQ